MRYLPILAGKMSMKDKLSKRKYYFFISINILLIGILLRLIGFFRGTSFFLDELNVARNIAEKSYFELFFPLEYDQFLPPFLAQLVKGGAESFGYTELGLRLFPFIAGVGSMVLFYVLLRRFFKGFLLIYPLVLFVFNFYLYQQGLLLKQYPLDVLLAILWLLIAIENPHPKGKQVAGLSVFGAISVWFSMPVVFVLSGVGIYFLWKKVEGNLVYSNAKNGVFSEVSPLLFMISGWLLSFGLLFWINLRHGIETEGLQLYHTEFFLEPPTSFANIEQSWGLFIGIFRAIVGKTTIAIVWAILCFMLGIYHLFSKEKPLLILLLLPILTCFFASMLHYYSLIIRLTLFLFPNLVILMGFGVVFLVKKVDFKNKVLKRAAIFLILFFTIFSAIHRNALPYFCKENVRGNSRLVLEKIAETKNRNLPLYATNFGISGYDFYTKYYEPRIEIPSSTVIYGDWNDDLTVLAKEWKAEGIERIWIFDTHTFGDVKVKMDADIYKLGTIETHFKDVFADAFLVKLK